MRGLIVPAGSPLVQFEIQCYADGVIAPPLPMVVWVDAAKPLKPGSTGIGCGCSGPFYPIRQMPEGVTVETLHDHTPSVCLCMGRFVE